MELDELLENHRVTAIGERERGDHFKEIIRVLGVAHHG